MSTPTPNANSLRIPEALVRALSEAVARAEDTAENIRQRADRRRALPDTVRVIAQVDQLGGTSQTQVATVRDLSAGGLAMLWGTFLHPATRCAFTVVSSDTHEPLVHATAQVVRCTHLKGSVHDVGVKFDEPIDLQRVPGASPEAHQAAASLEELAKDLLAAVQSRAETRRIEQILVQFSEDLRTARGTKKPPAAPAAPTGPTRLKPRSAA
ncbi:MAG TPA: PilZ domain-containing protein [Phycisphaerales bacterium]|nr:PilZ domain-containing protein [Phycisphaerales bacterium]